MSDEMQNDSYLAHVRYCEQTGEPQLSREQWYRQDAMNNRFIANHVAEHRSCGTCEHADYGMCAKSRMPCAQCWQYDTLPKWEAKSPVPTPNLPASIEPWQVPLWDWVNRYKDGNMVQRENAVVAILKVIRDAIAVESSSRNELLASRAQATADANERLLEFIGEPEFCDCCGLAKYAHERYMGEPLHVRYTPEGPSPERCGEWTSPVELIRQRNESSRLHGEVSDMCDGLEKRHAHVSEYGPDPESPAGKRLAFIEADRDILWDTVGYVFRRITEDADMAYHCCSSTETFARVARAVAHHADMPFEDVRLKMNNLQVALFDNPREVELQKRLDEAEQRIAVLEQLANPEGYLR